MREALDGQPLDLLGLAGMVIEATAGDNGPAGLDDLITAFIGTPLPETTALLAAFGNWRRTACSAPGAATPWPPATSRRCHPGLLTWRAAPLTGQC